MENNGDSRNRGFQPGLCREDHSMKNNGYSTGNEDYPQAEDQSMGTNGYSTGNEDIFQRLSRVSEWPPSEEFYAEQMTDGAEMLDLEGILASIDSAVSDQGSLGGARRNDDLNSHGRSRKRETDKAYRQRSKATKERIQKERDDFAAENGQLKRQIEVLKCEIQEKDELMKSTLEKHGNDIKEKERQVEILQSKLDKVELEKMVMKAEVGRVSAEVGRVEAEKELLQMKLAMANQISQTQSSETHRGRHLQEI
ncbi:hypothetical protein SLEP1_g12745 [Rubroshorea leprosula]|uniref:BZIP domain-containing protein n=1 Tax=Rubroshorea leprosula TaxID=152421 RepID=A0AAV5INA3_9ROSI|nr:hypothetical protein SLEP1_g12745 [Rubroshorea leprosula]